MSYYIYTTDGIILKRSPFGEANTLLYILTKDFGLIIAGARSSRFSVSKLRGALQEYTYGVISLVKGKNGWKITNAKDDGNFYYEYPEHSHKVLAQISSVLLKMIQGETPHPEIFETVKTGFEFLKNLSKEEVSNFEILAVLRILYELGYVEKDPQNEDLFKDMKMWNTVLLKKVNENKRIIIEQINKALKESHL